MRLCCCICVGQPDITAPGVNILAATSPLDLSVDGGYAMHSGTSMSTPHISGIVALVKALHPNWSPAAIKSALITTGTSMLITFISSFNKFFYWFTTTQKTLYIKLTDQIWMFTNLNAAWQTDPSGLPIFAEGSPQKLANPFDFGGGIVNPNGAADPGLVYDMGTTDYIHYLCAMAYNNSAISRLTLQSIVCPSTKLSILDVNLPSITIPSLRNSTTITRTVTNVGALKTIYRAVIEPPIGITVSVNPEVLVFNSTIKKISFKVTISTTHKVNTGYYIGSLTWTNGVHAVRSPLSVRTELLQSYADDY